MIPGIPTLGVRFEIEKVGDGSYGHVCWKIFWSAVRPEEIRSCNLFEGDTQATLNGQENVFCIAIQSTERADIEKIKSALGQNERFALVAARPPFVEGSGCVFEPLPDAGRIDGTGSLVGEGCYESRIALDSVRKERAAAAPKSSVLDQALNRRRR